MLGKSSTFYIPLLSSTPKDTTEKPSSLFSSYIRNTHKKIVLVFSVLTIASFIVLFAYVREILRTETREAKAAGEWMEGMGLKSSREFLHREHAVDDFRRYACENMPLPSHIEQALMLERGPENILLASGKPSTRLSQPEILIPPLPKRRGHNVTVDLLPTQPFCLRIFLPALSPEAPEVQDMWRYSYQPIHDSFWDSISLNAVSRTSGIVVDAKLKQWPGHAVIFDSYPHFPAWRNRSASLAQHALVPRDGIHIYEAEVQIVDPGLYDLQALLEYRDGRWNFEYDGQPMVPYLPTEIPNPNGLTLQVKPVPEALKENLKYEGIPVASLSASHHFYLPVCTRGDHAGRWVPMKEFKYYEYPKNSPAATEGAGLVWAPYTCRYIQYTYEQFNDCLHDNYPLIHWLGDSNTRRALKKIITQGAWCNEQSLAMASTAKQTACHCEDYLEADWNTTLFDPVQRANHIIIGNKDEQGVLKSAEIWNYKWDGLTQFNNPAWDQLFIDYPEESVIRQQIPDLPAGASHPQPKHKRWYLTLAPPRLLIVSLGNWDAAFLPYYQFYTELTRLVSFLRQRYLPYGTRIVYRPPQYFCCRIDYEGRRYTTLRVEAYDRIARQMLTRDLGAEVWDVYEMARQLPRERKRLSETCASNHVNSEMVEVENQVLMNMLCNRHGR
ncbi:uncharacterized protein VTP21DRAFT_10206 [Calcarisporiella thermophila]|uniref:uncharacterized protein n=1 Tax=Calcarisporiella thermophila TaxID=911321 RepID=UPI0037439B0D